MSEVRCLSEGLLQREAERNDVLKSEDLEYCAYILRSIKDGRYYYGSCQDLEARIKKHNGGEVRATRYRRPFVVHYTEKYSTRSEAFRREHFFKSIEGYKWLIENGIIIR